MSNTLDQAFTIQFSNNVYTLVREGGSKLRGLFPTETGKGEQHMFERMGDLTVQKLTTRNVPLDIIDSKHSRRMTPIDKFYGRTLIASLDRMKMMIDPTNEDVRAFADAQGKNYDVELYTQMLGDAASGKNGTDVSPFDTANQTILAGGTNFTVAKVNEALRILEANEVDIERRPVFMPLNAQAVADMSNDATNKFLSFDFQDKKMLAGAGVTNFRGINMFRTQYVPQPTIADTGRTLLFTRDNMRVALAKDIEIIIDTRNDLAHDQQITTYMTFGAVRMEEKTVVDIQFDLPSA